MNISKVILLAVVFFASLSVALATPVNVKTFGATGSGYIDDLIPIQNAINSVASTGGTVHFPAGYYNVSGTLSVPSNVRIQGMGANFNCQIRLTAANAPLFEVTDGKSNIIFKDLTLVGWSRAVWPRSTPSEVALIRQEGTVGISLKAATSGISNIVIENVRMLQFTQGIAATSSINGYDASISNVKIRNYMSDGNEYSLYTKTRGADNWDVQNMNVYPMYEKQNGIFLELSGQMSFLQLSCAGANSNGICAKLWGNGNTYFRQMHVEGPRLGFCVGSTNCDDQSVNTGENASLLTVENSATAGEIHRATNLVTINNRIWLDYGSWAPAAYKFFGTGANSWVVSCGNVWVSHSPYTHMSNTTVTAPPGAFPGLSTGVHGCVNNYISSVPAFAQGYTPDNERLNGEINVTAYPYNAAPNDNIDDTQAFQQALADARSTGSKRVFVPAGTFDIGSTLQLYEGETFLGEMGSIIRLNGPGIPLFKVVNAAGPVRGITWRNIKLTASSSAGTTGISMENYSETVAGAASDFMIQGVDFEGFETGIAVIPVNGDLSNPNPMYDSVSIKNATFKDNKTALLLRSQNASNWNLENINVIIPNGDEGVRVDGIGHLSIRNLTCSSNAMYAVGNSCVSIQRQSGTSIVGLNASNVLNALTVRWENGWTQFPVTIRNSNLLAGVYFQGRIYLNSVNNTYPANLSSNTSQKEVRFGAYQEGDVNNVAPGSLSDIFSCNDTFLNPSTFENQSTWAYSGTLTKPVTYCY